MQCSSADLIIISAKSGYSKPFKLSQVMQRNVEQHKNKHKHRVSTAYQAFLQQLLPLLELLHHKRKVVRS